MTSSGPAGPLGKGAPAPGAEPAAAGSRSGARGHGKADREEERGHRGPQSDLGVNVHRRVRILGIIYVPVTI